MTRGGDKTTGGDKTRRGGDEATKGNADPTLIQKVACRLSFFVPSLFPPFHFSFQAPAFVMQRQPKNHAKMMTAEEELHRRCAHRHSVRQHSGDVNLAHFGRGLKKQRRYSQRTIPKPICYGGKAVTKSNSLYLTQRQFFTERVDKMETKWSL